MHSEQCLALIRFACGMWLDFRGPYFHCSWSQFTTPQLFSEVFIIPYISKGKIMLKIWLIWCDIEVWYMILLFRAVYSRIQNLPNIENPFRINCPHLLMVADKGKRRVVKSPNHSIAWTCSWNSHEVISSSKGRCEPGGVVSRLTKRLAFIRFLKIYKNETGKRENFANITYEDAKKLAVMYQVLTVCRFQRASSNKIFFPDHEKEICGFYESKWIRNLDFETNRARRILSLILFETAYWLGCPYFCSVLW